jgi:DNA-binding NtrC family response regulator
VIDDEVLVRNVCQRILEREGILVHAASGGEEALRWLAAQHNSPPDLVILDMMMPGMDGLEVFEVLRHRYEGMKFILMSGFTEESLVALEQHREEISFLQKPFYPDDLRRLIKRLPASSGCGDARSLCGA